MTTCTKCHRALHDGDANDAGLCVFCAPAKRVRVKPGPNTEGVAITNKATIAAAIEDTEPGK